MVDLDVYEELKARIRKAWKEAFGVTLDERINIGFYDLEFRLKEIEYVNLNPIAETPERLDSIVYRNDSDEKDLQTWKTSRTETNKFTYEFQEGLKKLGAKFTVSIPFLAETEVSTELSFLATETTETSTSRTWSVDTQIHMPPRSKVTATLWLTKGIFDTPFTATVEAIGSTHVYFFIQSKYKPMDMSCTLNVLSPDQRTFTARGRFTGVMGTHMRIDKKQESLKSNSAREEARRLSIAKIKRQPDEL